MSRTTLVIVNPAATSTSRLDVGAVVDTLAGAGGTVDVAVTGGPAHATELAREARRRGVGLVVAAGGDGTVNEVANGLLADGPAARAADGLPALGVLPVGGMNVVGRSLGLSTSPPEAVRRLTAAARTGRRTVVNVGKVNARFFLYASGAGFGAEVMARVRAARHQGGRTSTARAVAEGVRVFPRGAERRRRALRISAGTSVRQAFALLVANTAPYAYVGGRPLNPCPAAAWDKDLEALAFTGASLPRHAFLLARMLAAPRREHTGGAVARFSGVADLSVTSEAPIALHVDGEPLPHCRSLSFRSVRQALAVAL
ncbi:diacylglycerol/lipid kinase family protein [Streptomyces longispororuber]|uniref:diacylglycerol/lipid kinase family protein n=1 Tax=Streptomyces longispororuber TaxID=68230 RepID=UPI003702D1F8